MADHGQMFQETPDQGTEGFKQEPTHMFEVGGRQYSAEDAKKKIENADMFIDTLKSEKDQVMSQYSTLQEEVAELRRQLDNSRKLEDALKPREETPKQTEQEQTTHQAVDEAAILRKLREELSKESQQEVRAKNMRAAIDSASKKYGSDWQTKLTEMGAELGMDQKAIQAMAETSPQAFARLFGLTGKAASEPAPSGSSTQSYQKPADPAPKSVMFGATTKDLVEQWRYSGKQVMEDYDPNIHVIPKRKFK